MKFKSASIKFKLTDHVQNEVVVDLPVAVRTHVWYNGKLQESSFEIQKEMVVWVFGKLENESLLLPYSGTIFIEVCGLYPCCSIPPPYDIVMKSLEPCEYCSYKTKRSIKGFALLGIAVSSLIALVIFNGLKLVSFEQFTIGLSYWLILILCLFLEFKMTSIRLPVWPKIGHWETNNYISKPVAICGFVEYFDACIESLNGLPSVHWVKTCSCESSSKLYS